MIKLFYICDRQDRGKYIYIQDLDEFTCAAVANNLKCENIVFFFFLRRTFF